MDLGPFATILGIWKDQGQPWKNYTVEVVQEKLKVVCQDARRGSQFSVDLHYQPLPPQLNWQRRYSLKLADFNPTDIKWRFPNGKQANHWRRPAPPPPRPPLTPPPAFSAFPTPSPPPVKRSRSRSRGTSASGIRGSTANAASIFEEDDLDNAEQALPVGSVENSPKAVDQEEVRIVVMTCGLRDLQQCEEEANFCVDMRSFYDPGCGPLKKHDGRHHEIIRRMVHHHLFMDLISDLRTRLADHMEAAVPTSDGSLHFLLYCKSGRHRSVAAGTLLHYILLCEGYSGVELQHVSLGDGCGCDTCSKPSAQRCLACEEGLRKWRNKD